MGKKKKDAGRARRCINSACRWNTHIKNGGFVRIRRFILLCALFLADSSCRTNSCTCTTAYTGTCVNYVLAVSLRDSAYRTFRLACTTAYTRIRNYVCHLTSSFKNDHNVVIPNDNLEVILIQKYRRCKYKNTNSMYLIKHIRR